MRDGIKRVLAGLVVVCLGISEGSAYEDTVHRNMSSAAFDLVYPDPEQWLQQLGIEPGRTFAGRSPRQWVIEGALNEDSVISAPPRPPRHFFNPITEEGLIYGLWNFTSAPDWAFNLDRDGLNPTYSIPGARQSFFDALTTNDQIKREKFWADTFETVGRIVHLIQDMAQPQHVRNDAHLTFGSTSDLILRRFSRYERYADQQGRDGLLDYTGYPKVTLPAFRKYWKEGVGPNLSGRGIAEFTNQYFVSQNTNLGKLPSEDGYFPSPSLAQTSSVDVIVTQLTDYRGEPILDPDGVPYANVKLSYLTNNYVDAYDGTFSGTNPRLASYSFFDFVTAANRGSRVYSMDNAVYQSTAQILIPRAVGYSAGLIEYFFRGKLQIGPPAEGVYALADHSLAEVNTRDAGGFTKLKVNVRNITPPLDGGLATTELITATGALRAVLKFRRNVCYEPTRLLGQPGAPQYGAGCKSAVEELVVSQPVTPDPEQINAAGGQDVTFNFPGQDVIPINGTDLLLQIVYRGQLGEETDAVAVATKDISEPSFYNFDNYSDCYRQADGTYSTVAGQPLTASMSFNGGASYNASVLGLEPGQYARYAVLADNDLLQTKELQSGSTYGWATVVNQDIGGLPVTTPIEQARPTSVAPDSNEDYLYAYNGYGYYPLFGYVGAQGCPTPVAPAPMPMSIVF